MRRNQPFVKSTVYLLGSERHHRRWSAMSDAEKVEDRKLRQGLLNWVIARAAEYTRDKCQIDVYPLEEAKEQGPVAVEVHIATNCRGDSADTLLQMLPLALSRERRRLQYHPEDARPALWR